MGRHWPFDAENYDRETKPPPLTLMDKEIVRYIQAYWASHGYGPTVREIATHCKFQINAAAGYLKKLVKYGRLEFTPHVPRAVWPFGLRQRIRDVARTVQ